MIGGIGLLQNRFRHTKRYREIMNAFLKNGFSHILFRLGITDRTSSKKDGAVMNMQDIGVKLRLTLQELGPTFIKLGQIASSRRDLVPFEIADELEKLQDHVAPFPFEQVKEIIETELEMPIDSLFTEFEKEPIATASIGQVHAARLSSGEKVAVKVQRPNIYHVVNKDLTILSDLARFLEDNMDWAEAYRLQDMVDEFARSLRDELDYRVEARSGERIAKQFEGVPTVHIPSIFWDLSTSKVLTSELIHGVKVNDLERLDAEGYDRERIAERIVHSMLDQILMAGFFHGDPHPGNIFVLPNNVISYLDFGMVGRLDDDMKYHFATLIIQLRKGNTENMIKTLDAMGILSDDTDMMTFKKDVDHLQSKYYDVPFEEIKPGAFFLDLFRIAYRHRIQIPTEITILGKSILTLEGFITKLAPGFSIMSAVEPFGKKLIMERYSPKNVLRKSLLHWKENIEILTDFPKDLKELSTLIRKGNLQMNIHIPQVQMILRRLDQVSNRLSFSIILLSFSILMVGLIVGASISGETNMLWRLPIIEAGSIIASLLFLYLIYSIFKSGRM